MDNLNLVLPEIFLSLSIMFLLIFGVFKKNSFYLIHNISLLVLVITAVITFNETTSINKELLFNQSVIIDPLSSLIQEINRLKSSLDFSLKLGCALINFKTFVDLKKTTFKKII